MIDLGGYLYGTAISGGPTGHGDVYRLSPEGRLDVLYGFCPNNDVCPDGDKPYAGLTYRNAAAGAFYDGVSPLVGATYNGGTYGTGTAFLLRPHAEAWKFSLMTNYSAACSPEALVMDSNDDVYETKTDCGGYGSVSMLHRIGRGNWNDKTLHSFCSDCAEGWGPRGPLLIDAQGAIVGTTESGGSTYGAAYKLTFDGGKWNAQVLHVFCAVEFCPDGAFPMGGLIADEAGNLFGTAHGGGGLHRAGTVFEISAAGFETLHSFCTNETCRKGTLPIAGLVMDANGDLFGKTTRGGAKGSGVVFELTR